jgi:DNA-binding IclR family transcriptional regulator
MLAEIQSHGYATATRTRRLVDEVNVSVPVTRHDGVLAVLTVRFMQSAVPLKSGLERFLPKLRQCAAKISTLFSEQQADARLSDGVAATP